MSFLWALSAGFAALTGCGGNDDGAAGTADGGVGARSDELTLCEKYGGADSVATVVQDHVLAKIAGDCRINGFFTALEEPAFVRVRDCLTIQVQELMGCDGVRYEGSSASNGLVCRDMVTAHAGLGISKGDFDALIEDVVAGLQEAGVEMEDIEAAAPALLALEGDIVERPSVADPTMTMCM